MKSVRIPAKVAREIKESLFFCIPHSEYNKKLIDILDAAIKPKKFVIAAKKRVKAKKAETRSEWEQIREKVLERAGGQCEAETAKMQHSGMLQVDHFLGGSGRRKSLQSKFTCWALCARCHWLKTENRPDAAFWLNVFLGHCDILSGVALSEGDSSGYAHAADIAKARLDSLRIQGRAE